MLIGELMGRHRRELDPELWVFGVDSVRSFDRVAQFAKFSEVDYSMQLEWCKIEWFTVLGADAMIAVHPVGDELQNLNSTHKQRGNVAKNESIRVQHSNAGGQSSVWIVVTLEL